MSIEFSSRRFIRVALIFEASLLLIAALLAWMLKTPWWEQLKITPAAVGLGVAACVPLLALLWGCRSLPFAPLVRLNQLVDQQLTPLFRQATLAELALVSALAGAGEECLFRGVLQVWLTRLLGSAAAVVLTSLAFGAAHALSAAYFVLAASISVYLAVLLIESENLLVPIIAHALYDFLALVWLVRLKRRAEA